MTGTEIERAFGPYLISCDGAHAVIRRHDDAPVEPTFYEMQHMKCMAFGGSARAVEIFPSAAALVDGQNQRHLWLVPDTISTPCLHTGESWSLE